MPSTAGTRRSQDVESIVGKGLALPLVLGVALGLSGCGESHEEHEGHEGHEEHHEGHDEHEGHEDEHEGHGDEDEHEAVVLTARQIEIAGIEIAAAGAGEIEAELVLTGEVALDQDRLAHVVPRSPGVVHEVMVQLGQTVEAGSPMAHIDSREVGEAQIEYVNAAAEVELAVARLELAGQELELSRSSERIADRNLEWQTRVHRNTVDFLARLAAETPLPEIVREFVDRPIGENRARLLTAYATLSQTRAAFERERTLLDRSIGSQSEFQMAQKEYQSAAAEFPSLTEEVGFENELALLESRQARQLAAQAVLVATQKVESERLALALARSSVRSAIQRLRVVGFSVEEIEAISAGVDDSLENPGRYALRAPISGRVLEKHITRGEQVAEEDNLYTIADLDSVWVFGRVYERDIPAIAGDARAEFTVRSYPGRTFAGRVSWIADTIDETTRTLPIRLEVDNEDRALKPGMFARITVSLDKRRVGILLPADAVLENGGQRIVFVPEGSGRFEVRQVSVGAVTRTHVEILSGLEAGERVVTRGAFQLKASMVTSALGGHAGHGH